MKKYCCPVCGYVYDPAKAPEGIPFEQLPSEWCCPICGAAKESFQEEKE